MNKKFTLNTEHINCLLCNENNFTVLTKHIVDEKTLNIVQCDCGFVYLNPRPTIDSISYYYNKNYQPHNTVKLSSILKLFKSITFFWKNNIIKKLFKTSSEMLDVGSGDGYFGQYMEQKGWQVQLYDKFTLNSHNTKFTQKKFDLVTMWHSLEHFHDSDNVIKDIYGKLNDNSYLLIALPNYNSVDRKIFKKKWVALDVPRHLYHFTNQTIEEYLNKHNFKIISSKIMYQDTLFNIFMSLRNNIFYKIIFFPILVLVSLFYILFNKNSASSILYICKKK